MLRPTIGYLTGTKGRAVINLLAPNHYQIVLSVKVTVNSGITAEINKRSVLQLIFIGKPGVYVLTEHSYLVRYNNM